MATRIQLIVDDHELDTFRQEAGADGLTLSAWLREAARAHLSSARQRREIPDPEALDRFFEECDRRSPSPESTWSEQLRVDDRDGPPPEHTS